MQIFRFTYRVGCGIIGEASAVANDEAEAKEIIIQRPGLALLLKPSDLILVDEPERD